MNNDGLHERAAQLPILKQCDNYLSDRDVHYLYYKEFVSDWVRLFYELRLDDGDYLRNMQNKNKKPVSELSVEEVLTRMTYIIRSDRHGGDRFDAAIDSGLFETLCYQLHFLLFMETKGE